MNRIIVLLILISFVPGILMAMGKKEQGKPVEFEVVESSMQGGMSEQTNLLAKTQDDFKYVWDLTHRYLEPEPDIPKIDFSKYMIACVMMGERTSSGYSVEVTDVTAYDDSVVVDVKYNETGGMLTVMTYPYQMIKMPRTNKKVIFNPVSE
jgi:hypothetical protein